jgi:hypothetical protein
MRGFPQLVVFLLVVASLAFGQVGNGTITGTVTDPAGLSSRARPWKPRIRKQVWLIPLYPPTPATIPSRICR